MHRTQMNPWLFGACFVLLLATKTGHAEIYKWTDANGKTHYTDNKDEAKKAEAQQLNMKNPTGPATGTSSARAWETQEQEFKQRRMQRLKEEEQASRPRVAKRPKSLSDGVSDNTDESKCNLAKDVLSGAVRHTNGAPTDKTDRAIAERDVQKYCR